MSFTSLRKKKFADTILSELQTPIGFADIGSGGFLKYPWAIIPTDKVKKFDFEPTDKEPEENPICVSDHSGKSQFNIAIDERSSSLHEPSSYFAERFGQNSIQVKKIIDVELITLDTYFDGRYNEVDLLDINAEGHDLHVLRGASSLLEQGFVKLIKVEFELIEVWKGQGWFSDIDSYLRKKNFDLVNIEIDYCRPLKARNIYHRGEPLWGKAYYSPVYTIWEQKLKKAYASAKDDILKAIALYTIINVPGRALDILDCVKNDAYFDETGYNELKRKICWTFKLSPLDEALSQVVKIGSLPLKALKRLVRN